MNKVLLVAQREFKSRVQKKSFLIATILIPLIFPAIMAVLIFITFQQEKNASKEVIHFIDESHLFKPDTSKFIFKEFHGSLEDAKKAFAADNDSYGVLYIPSFDIFNPSGIIFYSKSTLSPTDKGSLVWMIENQIKEKKMLSLSIDQKILDQMKTVVSIETIKISDGGAEQTEDTDVLFWVGTACGILMYMFIFIYGAQIMQGVIEEKSSKVVEVIISSVRPFQLMMGKIVGLASVGLLQFLIWIVLVSTLTTVVLAYFGLNMPQQQMMEQMNQQLSDPAIQNQGAIEFLKIWNQIPFTYMIFNFLFYFLGGYLIYGALFACVGSAVDSPAEAQQFMFPITIPLLISYLGLFTFILQDHDSTVSVWLSIIPFTSPIAMMGRIAFDPPLWQLILSMVLLVAGFMFTTWVAARIYRVGILMHGAKVNYKVLAKWFMMKN